MAGYKINFKKSVVLLHTKDKEAEKEIREISPFRIATKSIKYLVITITKEVKDLFDKTFKSLKKEIEEDTRKMEVSPFLLDWEDQHSKNGNSTKRDL